MSRKAPDTYSASIVRLKALVARLESAQVDVDELEAVVKESVDLVTLCRSRLRATQTSVDTLLAGLQDDAATPPASRTAAMVDDELDPFAEE
jgi:exodeoxyribonuclease VII small subunit